MKITIAPEILENYPGTHIGWLYACVVVEEKNDYVMNGAHVFNLEFPGRTPLKVNGDVRECQNSKPKM